VIDIQEKTISNIDILFKIKLSDVEICNQICSNLLLETGFDSNERSVATIEQQDSTLILRINAKDSISARATVNSYLKWLDLSFQLMTYIKKKS
jgi:KEOPS complex subunit Pcc1